MEHLERVDPTVQQPPETIDTEAPEADALEQAFPVSADVEPERLDISEDSEAPEADALDQARLVPLEEE